MEIGEGGSRIHSEVPTWALAMMTVMLTVVILLIQKALRHFGFERKKKKRAERVTEAIEMIILGLIGIGWISFLLTYGRNYISAMRIPGMVPLIGNMQLTTVKDLHQWRSAMHLFVATQVLICGYEMALRRVEVRNPPPVNSLASFQWEIRALRMTQAAPSLREAFKEEMRRSQNEE